MQSAELRSGSVLGRYEILFPVASGGMASVWAARLSGSRGFQKTYAIKTMLSDLSDDTDFEAMFLDEARLAARVRHPYVVEINDLGDEDGCLYIVMQWVDGETLFTLNRAAKGKSRMPLAVLLRVASEICAGLHAAHELKDDRGQPQHLVHRDVSPQNVMITYDGIVKVVDFGIAKATGRSHETKVGGPMKGKVPYSSPEQISGGKVDRRSDVFSLGILLYSTVSGLHPFKGESDNRTMENICSKDPVPLREIVAGVHPDLDALVRKALQKDPLDRFQSCAELQRVIDQLLGSVGTSVTDEDVAAWVREVVGEEHIAARRQRMLDAIQRADAGESTGRFKKKDLIRRETPKPTPGGAAMDNVLPVSLDDTPREDSQASAPRVTSPTAPFAPRPRASMVPYLLLLLALCVGTAAIVVLRWRR